MTKVIKSTARASAGIALGDSSCRMHGSKENYILADEKGLTFSGPIAFTDGAAQMRFGGLWTLNNELRLTIPSTTATPNPIFRVDVPTKQLSGVMQGAIAMMALFAGMV